MSAESTCHGQEKYELIVSSAPCSRDKMLKNSQAFDGDEFTAYIRAKVRGEKVIRPRLQSIKSLIAKFDFEK